MFRLKSLYIRDYKNIHEQTFDFSDNTGYIALIGLNGSGKSNLLEAISIIFRGLVDKKAISFEYDIKYEVKHNNESHIYERKKKLAQKDGIRVKDKDMVYPTSVIACYSGENPRLWDVAYKDYYMSYFKGAVRNMSFSPQFVYINKYCWKIAFLSLVCSSKASVLSFLKEALHIDDITTISIQFTSDADKRTTFFSHKACKWFDTIYQLQNEDSQKNINANVLSSIDMTTYGAPSMQAPDYVFQFLFLLTLPKKNVDEGQTIDKLITDIKISINGINFDNLSEGEKKMILIECITQVLGNEDSLVLLDEPDAHVHIENKKRILETITQYNGQTIFTTHSPIFTNLMENKDIFPIENGVLMSIEKQNLIANISGQELDIINGACIINSKFIVITEGSSDINYIQQAIKALRVSNPRLSLFDKVAFLPQGSADHTETFYNDVVSKLPDSVVSILYLFDNDQSGRTNAQKIQDKPKVRCLLYQPDYNTQYTATYYIEDFFPISLYGKQLNTDSIPQPIDPNLCYHQIKDLVRIIQEQKSIVDTIKKNIEKNSRKFDADNYTNFLPLLLEILNQFNLQ